MCRLRRVKTKVYYSHLGRNKTKKIRRKWKKLLSDIGENPGEVLSTEVKGSDSFKKEG